MSCKVPGSHASTMLAHFRYFCTPSVQLLKCLIRVADYGALVTHVAVHPGVNIAIPRNPVQVAGVWHNWQSCHQPVSSLLSQTCWSPAPCEQRRHVVELRKLRRGQRIFLCVSDGVRRSLLFSARVRRHHLPRLRSLFGELELWPATKHHRLWLRGWVGWDWVQRLQYRGRMPVRVLKCRV